MQIYGLHSGEAWGILLGSPSAGLSEISINHHAALLKRILCATL